MAYGISVYNGHIPRCRNLDWQIFALIMLLLNLDIYRNCYWSMGDGDIGEFHILFAIIFIKTSQ